MRKRVLLVSNGYGETAICARLAGALHERDGDLECDHLALVGEYAHGQAMRDVGPRATMPSGGILAMGNLRNIARDIRAGLLGHTFAQIAFLRRVRGSYHAVIAIGDTFALLMANLARGAKTIFVGTAKSVYVAPYGPVEERILAKSDAVFVRDAATAERLQQHGVNAQAPGNVIVDLYARVEPVEWPFPPALALFPGSRSSAYADAVALCAVVREMRARTPLCAALSIAPGLDADRFAGELRADGWGVTPGSSADMPFVLHDAHGGAVVAWAGSLGAMLACAMLVIGQAGTANEAAAAAGIPVIALDQAPRERLAWYRSRQRGLLGEAMRIVSCDPSLAAREIEALLADPQTREQMGRAGQTRMGRAGGIDAIAAQVITLVRA